MHLDDSKLSEVLLKGGYVSSEDISVAEEYAKKHRSSIRDYLLSEKIISPDILGQATAEYYKVEYSDLNSYMPAKETVSLLPEEIAREYRAVVFKDGDSRKPVIITTDDPKREGLEKALRVHFKRKKFEITYSLPEDVDAVLVYYRKALDTRFQDILEQGKRIAPEIITQIFEDAVSFHSSDIHFEPQLEEVLVRFRIDGILTEAGRIPKEYYDNIVNRIKVMARLRIDDHFSAQDGAIRFQLSDHFVDLRVSIAPTVDGEKIVIRVLSAYVRGFTLSDLGLSPTNRDMLEAAAKKPFGMILVTGPTGSGKTTTLYALLKILARPEVNITTIEDPVEYKVVGINQIQVNPQTNLTFAKGLRSIARQDPDIILVGEIRDQETADISVNAALTGHLLLSTFHANDSATGIPRLLDMGVEPFLLASTLELIIAQRLVRKICEVCRYSKTFKGSEISGLFLNAEKYFGKQDITLYEGKGCVACNMTGFKGRTAIFEFIEVNQEMRDLVLKRPSTKEIWEEARKGGSLTLFEDGIDKVKNGVTTVNELLRVAQPPKK